jgi:predicted metallo-beta-lactamase superfamily hydrolase
MNRNKSEEKKNESFGGRFRFLHHHDEVARNCSWTFRHGMTVCFFSFFLSFFHAVDDESMTLIFAVAVPHGNLQVFCLPDVQPIIYPPPHTHTPTQTFYSI